MKRMEKEISTVNKSGMKKRFQMYAGKAAELAAKAQRADKKGERN